MSKAYLRNTIILLVFAYLVFGQAIGMLFRPMIEIIQNLDSGTKAPSASGYQQAAIVFGVIAIITSAVAAKFSIKGARRDPSRRVLWVILSFLAVLILLPSIAFTAVSPRFFELYKDMSVATPQANDRSAQENVIKEAVFRYQIKQTKDKIYFLSVGETGNADPSDEFMSRFKNNHPPVKKWSQSKYTSMQGVRDKTTGARGVILTINSIKWKNGMNAEVEGSYFWNVRASAGYRYTVVKKNGVWTVVNTKKLFQA
ncbi:MAG: hypothetical protein ABFD64_11585 [Armatimonadota bacterium]